MVDINTPAFYCLHPACGRLIPLLLCKEGANKDRYYLCCKEVADHTTQRNYWHMFPPRVAPIHRSTLMSYCADHRCTNSRVNKLCPNKRCKSHCEAIGGCPCHPVQPAVSPPRSPLSNLAHKARIYSSRVPLAAEKIVQLQKQIHDDRVLALALATPLPPSPTSSEDAAYSRLLGPLSPLHSMSASPRDIQRSLTIVYWAGQGPAHIETIQNLLAWQKSWPHICLNDVPSVLKTRSHPHIDAFYQHFDVKRCRWVKVAVSHIYTVQTDDTLFIRRLGAKGSDEMELLPMSYNKPSASGARTPVAFISRTPSTSTSRAPSTSIPRTPSTSIPRTPRTPTTSCSSRPTPGPSGASDTIDISDSDDDEVLKRIKKEPGLIPTTSGTRKVIEISDSEDDETPTAKRRRLQTQTPEFPSSVSDAAFMDSLKKML
ncbi:hypothetical protein B0H16DRAFT_1759121 [Mycena metata]|uniref:Uncharacterized protein n=1 Tax=Mycena metata TaxID=1033252 RepID=A0AAD7ID27_9AGAR|nr:hypothetical protein B0H16DRAFT_1759121 [Mycena metata]